MSRGSRGLSAPDVTGAQSWVRHQRAAISPVPLLSALGLATWDRKEDCLFNSETRGANLLAKQQSMTCAHEGGHFNHQGSLQWHHI